jgi:phosphoglucomutase
MARALMPQEEADISAAFTLFDGDAHGSVTAHQAKVRPCDSRAAAARYMQTLKARTL